MSSALIDHVVSVSVASQASRPWTPAEDDFLQANLANFGFDEVGRRLGRSANGVKIRQVRKRFHVPSKRPGWLTGNGVAKVLGIDIHAVMIMHRRGIFKFQVLPGERRILQIKRISLWLWAVNPENWIYFRPEKVRHPRLRRLIALRKERWDDEWWTTGDVARHYGLAGSNSVNRQILDGKLPATRWGNWYVKRSDALARPTYPGKGGGQGKDYWPAGADAFILRARADGMMYKDIAARMGWDIKRVQYRYRMLKEQGA